ncbi:lactate utilization protein B [Poseidonibacter ostreae]|jgi:L-lactate dehydrogenase complex protein LldF|uniref:4Fe-4S dicluster domain-containing protein n=1 Tax=Poseidonibacter ostreae TaxID=2654171 RepID=A0A6L4WTC0_9BACT|nr:lactate utilization protein B [Poseidonibacter ostreae]KAB7887730.1 4Fe-4S dicluster domain-containing protein [Poseidonibacter ostreae]KAB7889288.1 4Fe-4S dicluster domain-containing protein [Poseidonibacter ostreae]KAB7892133.1 4Fe-4S dicluster domain-containing protein [Poseidonibacter ostreae]MAD42962.1 4Fe-4S ferredoxin [Arcobacter sp.]
MSTKHPQNAKEFVADDERMHWHDQALWFVREKRDIASKTIPEWEQLREFANRIKSHTMANLDTYLLEFEKNANAKGITVHYAADAKEHNEIAYKLLKEKNVKKLVKSKSMLTEECHLNPFLEDRGIEVIDTDLGERIVQLRNEPPSHIVLPAIHLKKMDVSDTFVKHLGTEPGNDDPTYLTRAARASLREDFLTAEAGMTGVNFAIAETGGVVVCTNEGNADMGASVPKLHIASMGIEKVIPRLKDLSVFTRLLARSATGQPITSYTSHFHAPIEGGEMHIIIVDNKRSEFLSSPKYKKALNCIRCGACMNTCPVYRRSGGHSYEYVIPGPIGSILGSVKEPEKHNTLPFACTLCGSCTNVCPVKIDLDSQLYARRQDLSELNLIDSKKKMAMKVTAWLMTKPKLFDFAGKMARKIVPKLPDSIVYNKANAWGKQRDMPKMAEKSFKEMFEQGDLDD